MLGKIVINDESYDYDLEINETGFNDLISRIKDCGMFITNKNNYCIYKNSKLEWKTNSKFPFIDDLRNKPHK